MNDHRQATQLEDELGDVLEKALARLGLSPDEAAQHAGIEASRLRDALDWRSELSEPELHALASLLGLNEIGLCALASGKYPLPQIGPLPFCIQRLQCPHGIGVANAYLVSSCQSNRALLFDTGTCCEALLDQWPQRISGLDAIFITHEEHEHSGGLAELRRQLHPGHCFGPSPASNCQPMKDGDSWSNSWLQVRALATPGHAAAHNSYVLSSPCCEKAPRVLISGDLLFAGSVGCPLHCPTTLRESLKRVTKALPPATVIAPGHGPMTTLENELRYNPFL